MVITRNYRGIIEIWGVSEKRLSQEGVGNWVVAKGKGWGELQPIITLYAKEFRKLFPKEKFPKMNTKRSISGLSILCGGKR